MTEYYYTQNPEVLHEKRQWQFTLLGKNLIFNSDSGVFSKDTVDYGTRVLLDALDLTTLTPGPVLDVGCGYGPIGLAIAANLPDVQVDMIDVNERALGLCQQNAQQNQLENVTVWQSDVYEKVAEQNYQAIISNPPVRAGKEVVTNILTQAYAHLAINGTLTIVL